MGLPGAALSMTDPSPAETNLVAVLQAERARGFEGLTGSRVEAILPLRQAALDAALTQVRAWPPAVEALSVEIRDGNRLNVTATVRVLGFRTPLRLQLRLAPSMEDGIVRLDIDDGSLMASAVTLLGPLLGNLPEGVRLEGRQLTVDVRRLAALGGFDDIASMVSKATFESRRGVLSIYVLATAPALGPPALPVPRVSSGRALPFDAGQLRAWLSGACVDADVRMDERLANHLLTALHADAQTPSGDEGRDIVMRALQPPVVRFEAGALRLTTAARIDQEDSNER